MSQNQSGEEEKTAQPSAPMLDPEPATNATKNSDSTKDDDIEVIGKLPENKTEINPNFPELGEIAVIPPGDESWKNKLMLDRNDLKADLEAIIPLLHRSAQAGDLDMVRQLLDSKSSTVKDQDCARQTPLLYATGTKGNLSIVQELLRRGADPNACDLWGGPPLHNAARCNDVDVIEELLKQRLIMINLRDIHKWTALHISVALNHVEIVKRLLKAGADRNVTTEKGFTPMAIAKDRKFHKVIEAILKQKSEDFDRERQEAFRRH